MHPTNFRPGPGPTRRRTGDRRRPGVLALLIALACLAGLAIAVLQGSLPGTGTPEVTAIPAQGRLGAVSWPADGTSAADISGTGVVQGPGATRPVPIASVAKLMTAYVILRDHPLTAEESGPDITVEPSEAAGYSSQVSDGDSVVAVAPGEEISERHALEALLLPSADNMAWILARWDAGSQDAFVAKMNAAARSLGMAGTSYTDASGLDSSTVSTAADQVRLGAAAMRMPALAAIADMPEAVVPVAGTVRNTNTLLGQDGIVGLKTGSTQAAGGCFLVAARQTVDGRDVLVVAATFGHQGPAGVILPEALRAGDNLVLALDRALGADTRSGPHDNPGGPPHRLPGLPRDRTNAAAAR